MTTAEQKAKEIVGDRDQAVTMVAREYGPAQAKQVREFLVLMEEQITTALREAEQAAIDRCRKIISTAIIDGKADAEAMRHLLLAAFDPSLDVASSIIRSRNDKR